MVFMSGTLYKALGQILNMAGAVPGSLYNKL